MTSVMIVQQKIPHYRIDFFQELFKKKSDLLIIHSSKVTDDGLVDSVSFPFPNKEVKQYKIFKFIWQSIIVEFFYYRPKYLVLGLELKFLANWVLFFIASLFNAKIIWWTHGYNVHIQKKGLKYVIDRFFKTVVMKRAYKVFLYTDYNKNELIGNGIPENKIVIINNAINNVLYKKHYDDVLLEDLKQVDNLTFSTSNTISFIGRLTPQKKPHLVLKLAEILLQSMPDLRIFIIGDGPMRAELEFKVHFYGLNSNVFFLGAINDPIMLATYMRLTKIIVLPGAVGLGLVHSFIYGIPFVTLKHELHSPEISYLDNNRTGFMAEDLDSMADWIKNVINDENALSIFRRNCLEKIEKDVNLNHMVNSFAETLI